MKRIVLLFCLSLIVGCSTLPSEKDMAKQVSNYKLPYKANKNEALVYVVRPSGLGTIVRFNVFLDDKEDSSEMGYTRGSQHIYFYVNPGKHKIYSKAENWSEIDGNFEAGKTYFIRQDVSMGFLMARGSLKNENSVKGKYYMMKTSKGTIKKERKN